MLAEISEYLNSLEQQRTKIFAVLESAPVESWNWTPSGDETNSLFVLATHVIGAEHGWIFEILGGGAQTRNRPTEFLAKGDSLDALRADYARVAKETRDIFEKLTEQDLASTRYRESHGEVSVRWIILHIIKHDSEHLGQMELTKQLWEQKKD
ncbi:MAG: hypothetical protein BroJett039_11470 [Chloroflexota bacterium]|nr:MAG: hypothetical protein BroJett039_11470 [Chloroflexota bacterium]